MECMVYWKDPVTGKRVGPAPIFMRGPSRHSIAEAFLRPRIKGTSLEKAPLYQLKRYVGIESAVDGRKAVSDIPEDFDIEAFAKTR